MKPKSYKKLFRFIRKFLPPLPLRRTANNWSRTYLFSKQQRRMRSLSLFLYKTKKVTLRILHKSLYFRQIKISAPRARIGCEWCCVACAAAVLQPWFLFLFYQEKRKGDSPDCSEFYFNLARQSIKMLILNLCNHSN